MKAPQALLAVAILAGAIATAVGHRYWFGENASPCVKVADFIPVTGSCR